MTNFVGPAAPITQAGFDAALSSTGAAPEALWAVLAVETAGCGFQADRRPKILFERHVFHRLTGGRYDAQAPDVSAPTAGGYGAGGAHQYERLLAAIQLDREAALMSASWGLGQIMGENFSMAGFGSVQEMVDGFVSSEDIQLEGFANFLKQARLDLLLATKSWTAFARGYNGPNYAANRYDEKLASSCGNYQQALPDLTLRAVQVLLTYAGFQVGGVDGKAGPMTRGALQQFQARERLPVTGEPDQATAAALAAG